MTTSHSCLSAEKHVALADDLPTDNYSYTFSVTPNEQRKTLRRSICLEMLCALSVTKISQLKLPDLSCGKLSKPLMDGHSLTIEKTVTKF